MRTSASSQGCGWHSNRSISRQRRTSGLLAVAVASCLVTPMHAQAPAFDVVSIRLNPSTTSGVIRPTPNGQLTATGVTIRALILRAHGLHDAQLIGAPGWADTERFDIDARIQPPPDGGPEALMPMLRTLLADRFRLETHEETRELAAYVLMQARADGRLGPQIRPTVADCTRMTPVAKEEITAAARDGWPPCGQAFTVSFLGGDDSLSKVRVRRAAVSMTDFARALQSAVGRPVIDRTDLAGRFDVEYSYAPPSSSSSAAAGDSNLPMLLVALEEQLGLRLEARRTVVPVLVIDSLERPAPN